MTIARPSHKTSLCALALSLGLASAPTWAQTATSPEDVVKAATQVLAQTASPSENRILHLRNVRPSLLAYWLDAAHHPAPPEVRASGVGRLLDPPNPLSQTRVSGAGGPFDHLNQLPRLPGNGNGPLDLKLPAGVDSVVAIDPQNTLVVRGTQEGFDALVALLPTVDIPIVQYEIEAQFVQLDRSTLAELDLNFPQVDEESAYSFGSVVAVPPATKLWTRLHKVLDDTGGKVLSAPRVLVIEGLQASLAQTVSTPFIVDDELARQQFISPPNNTAKPNERLKSVTMDTLAGTARMSSEIGVRTLLVRRPNNLVTLGIAPTFGSRTLTVETTIREDQGIAIQMSPSKDKQQLIVFVKATRVRRDNN